MNLINKRMYTVSIATLGLFALVAGAQGSGTAEPASGAAETTAEQPVEQTGHEGHGHATGVSPSSIQPISTTAGDDPDDIGGPSANSVMLFKDGTVNTGEILDTESVPVEFEFMNTGSEDLVIRLVKPSCGCTIPEMEKKIYKPGEKGILNVTFDPSGKRGALSRNITVYTNSKTKPVQTIILQSFVKPVILTEPRILSFDIILKGASATKDIKVFGRFEGFKVTRATTTDSDVFELEILDGGKVEKDGDDMWLQIIRVTVLESAPPNSHRTEISVRTNDENKPLFSLAVVGMVIGDLQLVPVRMTLGRIMVGDEFSSEIKIKSMSGKAFEIKSVSSGNVVLDAEYSAEPVDPKVRDEWVVRVAGTVIHPAQRFNAQITVMTDVPDEEMVEVQMYGQLQPQKP